MGEIMNALFADCVTREMRKNRIKILLAEHEISAKDLADKIGKQAQTLRRYVRHEAEPKLEVAEAIADALGCTVDAVLGVEVITSSKPTDSRMLPVYGAAQGGVGFDITDVREPIDSIEAPPYLQNSVDAYAVYVTGDSMVPRFNPGEVVYVHPGKPFKANDSVIVQFEDNKADHAIIKTFKKMDEKKIFLSQFNPDKTISYQRLQVKCVHKIIGVFI
jgi:phage repressor protein C with HTH and peptisase S24 domain